MGSEDIAVKLLQAKDEDHKVQALPGVDEQNQQRRRHQANDRAEERDDIRYADDCRNQHRVRQLEDQHPKIAENTDDQRVNELADDKAAEDFICPGADVKGRYRSKAHDFGG